MSDAKPVSNGSQRSLRVVSYNLRKGKGIRAYRPTLDDILLRLETLEADLLLCQEVFHGSSGVQQSDRIAGHLGVAHRYEPNATYRKGHHGNATFSGHPISRHRNKDISTNRVERRGILYTRVHPSPGVSVHVFNTHFGLSQGQRMRQAYMLGEMMRDLTQAGDSVLVAGDFNDWSGRVDPVICREGDVENAMLFLSMRERRTWSTRRPLFALDRVYYRNLHLADARVHRHPPWTHLSDHFPVETVFEIPSPKID